MIFEHKSVLLEEILENLNIQQDGVYVDLHFADHQSPA